MTNLRLSIASAMLLACAQVLAAAQPMTQAAVFDQSGQEAELAYLDVTVERVMSNQLTSVVGIHEPVRIQAKIVPSAAQTGNLAHSYFIIETGGIFYAANTDGQFQIWDGSPASLPANHSGFTLESETVVPLFEGQIPVEAQLRFYFAYALDGGAALYYTPVPTTLELANPVVTNLVLNSELSGVNYDQLRSAEIQARQLPYLNSLLVARSGQLVLEQYFDGGSRDSLRHVRSVTKSITSLIVGKAIESAIFSGVNQTLGSLVGDYIPPLEDDKAIIELRHLLSMTSGFSWNESNGALYDQWSAATDPIGFLLNRNLAAAPGTAFAYNSAAVNLFSALMMTASGKSIDVFAQESLLDILQIDSVSWELLGNGLPNSSGGLQLRPVDQIKLGTLIINRGLTLDESNQVQRLLSDAWFDEMFAPRALINENYGNFMIEAYADLWWIIKAAGKTVYLAWGWGGQFLGIIPELDLVLVTTADWENLGVNQASLQEGTIANLLITEVLPAFSAP